MYNSFSGSTVNDYRIIVSGDDYNAPEIRRFHLQGTINGEGTTTSALTEVHSDHVITRSGSIYFLGTKHAEFISWEEVRKKNPAIPMK